jgi:hypothetical protein
MTIAATRGASGGDSRKDIRVVGFLALPGALATVLSLVGVPAAWPSLLRACGRTPGWVGPVFDTIALSAVISLLLTPFALVKGDRIRQPLGAGTKTLVLLSMGPLLVVSLVVLLVVVLLLLFVLMRII